MAQLPPKIPSAAEKRPSWADDFVHFAAARRGLHRRSASDPIAFLELDSDRNSAFDQDDGHNHLIMSMLSCDDAAAFASHTLDPSDDGRTVKKEPRAGEDEDEMAGLKNQEAANGGGAVVPDQKRLKRILANRQSAQRSRVRKLQYISELERSVTSLQSEVSALSPRVAFLDHQRLILNVDNSALKQRIAALAQDKVFKDAHQEALRKEVERLRRVYQQQQNLNKLSCNGHEDGFQKPMLDHVGSVREREMMMMMMMGRHKEEEDEDEGPQKGERDEERMVQMREGGRCMVQAADHHQLQAFT